MKCQHCSSDAPAETDPLSGRLRCPKCHTFFGSGTTQPAAVRHARDILQKWSTADLLDQISSFPQIPPLAEPVRSAQGAKAAPAAESLPEESEQAGPLKALGVATGNFEETDSPASIAEKPSPDGMNNAADILSLAAAIEGTEPLAHIPEAGNELQQSPDKSVSRLIPQLSIIRADDSLQPANSQEGESTTGLAEAESAGLAASSDPEQTKKQKRRRLTRSAMTRRPVQAFSQSIATFQERTETPLQGIDAVKKKLRVDRPGSSAQASDIGTSTEKTIAVDPRAQDASVTRRFRVDAAEGLAELTDGSGRVRAHSRPQQRYIDEPHETAGLRGPHFEVSSSRRSSLTSLTGQFLAYVGVLGLTVGTAIVIYGHFGGYSDYTPTGWLVTTVAQMLLFLGVINLVSGGIEQNNNDVSRRINVLGEQLMRIEQVTESAVHGPKIPVERYAGTATAEDMSENGPVYVEDRR